MRHGQAMHNPRAEAARKAGCSFEEFIQKMKEDDCFDAHLTQVGIDQAKRVNVSPLAQAAFEAIDIVIASPLSRAICTADLAFPSHQLGSGVRRVVIEDIREVNGLLLNGKRRARSELQRIFPEWDFSDLRADEDHLWTSELEAPESVRERAYRALSDIAQRPERAILVSAHGGLLKHILSHPQVTVDGNSERLSNCELRKYAMRVKEGGIHLEFLDSCT